MAIGQAKSERGEVFQRRRTHGADDGLAGLDEATKTIGQFWKRKNARRNGLIVGKLNDSALVDSHKTPKNRR
jgi:hypothetical protein